MTRYLLTTFSRVALLVIFASGCATDPPTPAATGSTEQPARQAEPGVQRLLEAADRALSQDRLTTPANDNAWQRYLRILDIDPGNADAQAGITAIADRYLSWSIEHARDGSLKRARMYLGKAEEVDPGHPSIPAVARLINDQEQLKTERYPLDPHMVKTRQASPRSFDTIANRIRELRPFVRIRAPDDAAGRWIYQQLQARLDFRIEATFDIRSGYSVELSR